MDKLFGFGSGSTSYLAVLAIAEKIKKENIKITAIPTSTEIRMLCGKLNIPTATLIEKKPDWCFDGADEVDNNKWLIKGRGGAMFKEKLNMVNSPITYILIDNSKKVNSLGKKHKIPVEIYPDSISYVTDEIIKLGAEEITLRQTKHKDGPVKTENGKLDWKCPNCGNMEHSKMNVARRTCGYIGSQFWSQGRTEEIKDRFVHLGSGEI